MTIETIMAGDPDSPSISNGQLSFALIPSTTPFTINGNGDFILATSLDRETQENYILNLTVSDGGTPSLAIFTIVTFTVSDVNDNAPVLDAPSLVDISESTLVGSEVARVHGFDPDLGVNDELSYRLTGSQLFEINDTGKITLVMSLDYENSTQHTVMVVATDSGDLSSRGHNIVFNVINENDNSPIFTMDRYRASVTEGSSTGTPVITVQADDADADTLGEVSYSIISGNSNDDFAIDSISGEITVNGDIDREVIGEYTLTIRAQDGGSPARSDRSIVAVTVGDVNDNSPIFQRSSYAITVREDINVPADLLTLVATDADEANSQNSAITYSIQTGNTGSVFNLATSTGVLSVTNSLDFETTPSYSLNVVATDGGSRTGNAVVTVTVTDVNDNTPVIDSAGPFTIMEQKPSNSLVGSVSASDQDSSSNAELSFRITQQPLNLFTIIPDGGSAVQIRTATVLDREALVQLNHFLPPNSQSDITIEVSDNGSPRLTSSVTVVIRLEDINDNAPILVNPVSEVNISESSNIGTVLTRVVASDVDIGVNALVSYSLTGSSSFTIDSSTGIVTLASSLDYETRREHTIMVTASNPDGVNSTEHAIVVRVIDAVMGMVGGDPHFRVPLLSDETLCFSIQGYPGLIFNLIYNDDFVINALFVDSIGDKNEATWIGNLAITPRHSNKSNAVIFNSVNQEIILVDQGNFKASIIDTISYHNGKMSVKFTPGISKQAGNPTVHVKYNKPLASFDVTFYSNHLDVNWDHGVPKIHGLMGMLSKYV